MKALLDGRDARAVAVVSLLALTFVACGEDLESAEVASVQSAVTDRYCSVKTDGPPGGCPDCLQVCVEPISGTNDVLWTIDWAGPGTADLTSMTVDFPGESLTVPSLPVTLSASGVYLLGQGAWSTTEPEEDIIDASVATTW